MALVGAGFWSVWTTATNDVWLSGTKGTLLHWDGATYTADTAPPNNSTMASLWSPGGGEYWAVGSSGLIFHKVGAAGWAQVTSPTTSFLYSIAGTSANDIWAVGSGGVIVHYDGVAWSLASSPTALTLRNNVALPGGGYRAVGDNGLVLIHP